MIRRALLLDLDGTLADSLGVMRLVYARFLGDFGRAHSQAEFDSLNGPPLHQVVRHLRLTHGLPGDDESLLESYRTILDQAYAQVSPSAGARELVQAAKQAGWAVGVVTSNGRKRSRDWLEHTSLTVDFLVGGEDALPGKPAPTPYVKALEIADCRAEHGVAVEDSLQGAQSARAAGLMTFGIETGPMEWPEGTLAVSGLAEVTRRLFS